MKCKITLLITLLFSLTQILPVNNFLRETTEVNVTIVENTNLQRVVQKTLPACVYIEVTGEDRYTYGYDRNFGRKWSGSGAIISPDGLIITAGHIVKDAVEILVRLSDGQEFITTNFYRESCTDVGVIKINPVEKLPYISIGSSGSMVTGDPVFIIGCPFGELLSNTATAGIVSGTKRDLDFFGEKLMLQVDAASWPGNSGGGVFNLQGELIGVLVGGMRGADDISFCIPSDIVKLCLNKYAAVKELEKKP